MQRLELIIVQFDEIKQLIEVGRAPQLRLAPILLDGAIELIMHRMAEAELRHESFNFDQLQNLRRLKEWRESDDPLKRQFAKGPTDEDLRADIQRLEGLVTSNTRRKRIESNFIDKLHFLVERNLLPAYLSPVLKRLHEYRNETYHRDQHRVEVLRPPTLIYFDAACTVLDHYEPGMLIGADAIGPELARFHDSPFGFEDPFSVSHRAATWFRRDVGLDLPAVRAALVSHLLNRLYELQSGLEYIEENSVNGAMPGDAIRLMQVEDGDIDAIFNIGGARHARRYPLTMSDIASWIERATAMETIEDKHLLFAELAALETPSRILNAGLAVPYGRSMRPQTCTENGAPPPG